MGASEDWTMLISELTKTKNCNLGQDWIGASNGWTILIGKITKTKNYSLG